MKEIVLPDTIPLLPIVDPWEQQDAEGPDSTKVYQFYKNLSEGKLTMQRCKKCGNVFYPPQAMCKYCNSTEYEWEEIPKTGEIHAFSALLLGFPMIIENFAPFVVAVARFGDYPKNGVQIIGIMFDTDYRSLKIGDRVEWEIMRIKGPGEKVRYWYCFRKV
ncbi:MAG: Zn-ribbon domain-containing OB-fold protein [Archaeoglobales archaeon]|nr:Zn-ribbon domain-containing OB-fold protein [Archaeoglobales archaeon]